MDTAAGVARSNGVGDKEYDLEPLVRPFCFMHGYGRVSSWSMTAEMPGADHTAPTAARRSARESTCPLSVAVPPSTFTVI
ncbi:hypothetical protein D3C72_2262050 [compost metagenome]